ncbi:MAG: ComEC/Rec2 family competence protein [Candidatus Omnitrophica bacterium]|nr:ComEC/Rec2 family competence protein [Candidatus Omnitrophota bacterium]
MAAAAATFLIWITGHFLTGRVSFIPWSVLIFFLLGMLYGANERVFARHDLGLSGPTGPLVLEGVVESVPEAVTKGKKETVSFVLKSDNFFKNGRVYETTGWVQVFLYNPGRTIRFGDRLRLKGVLEVPKEKRNPHVFDYADYLAKNGIYHVFRGIGRFSILKQLKDDKNQPLLAFNEFRVFLRDRLKKLLPSPYHELASALLLGFRKEISQDLRDRFVKTGTAHLLAISGLHVSAIGGLLYFLLTLLGIPRTANLSLTAVFISIYAVLAGANIPVLRATIMGTVMLLGLLLGQERNAKSAFFFALVLILAQDPKAVFLASFQLSFIAIASLIFILPKLNECFSIKSVGDAAHSISAQGGGRPPFLFRGFRRLQNALYHSFLASLAVTLGMFPFLVFYFNLFSVVGFLANLIVIPICTMAIAASFLVLITDLIVSPLASFLAPLAIAIFRFKIWLIYLFSEIPFGYFYLPRLPWLVLALYYGALVGWLSLSHRPVWVWFRWVCFALISYVFLSFFFASQSSSLRLVFFDLGKSDCVFVHFSNGSRCLINTGRRYPNDEAYWVLRPFLMGSGIQKIDSVILTQVSAKTAGGFLTLKYHVRFQDVWVPSGAAASKLRKYLNPEAFRKPRIQLISSGERLQFGSKSDAYVQVLALSAGEIGALRIVDGSQKILLIFSWKREVLQQLSGLTDWDYNGLYLPHDDVAISEDERNLLQHLSPAYVISNQRDSIKNTLVKLQSLIHGEVLSVGEKGAVELFCHPNGWAARTYRKPRFQPWLPPNMQTIIN